MHREEQVTKMPLGAEQPFPWKCRHCGQSKVIPQRIDYPDEVRYDGRLVSFLARDIEIPICQNCGEKVFTEVVDRQLNDALRAHLQLLTPAQIREGIDQLGMTQKEVAERLGIAEATLSRWLTETVIQSRAMDNYLRMFLQFPEVRTALAAVSIDSTASTVTMPDAV